MRPVVLSLCDRTGVMVEPWRAAGYDAITVDLKAAHREQPHRTHIVADVRRWTYPNDRPLPSIVFAFPPCSHLAVSGARWFRGKGLRALIEALEIVEACRSLCEQLGAPYMIENPVSVLSSYWREPDFVFDPCDYGDPYTKATCLWTGNGFIMPARVSANDLFERATMVEPVLGSAIEGFGPSADRADLRSITPGGFSSAVFAANHQVLKGGLWAKATGGMCASKT
jgi:hypothetical protein